MFYFNIFGIPSLFDGTSFEDSEIVNNTLFIGSTKGNLHFRWIEASLLRLVHLIPHLNFPLMSKRWPITKMKQLRTTRPNPSIDPKIILLRTYYIICISFHIFRSR